jgi:tRNA(Ile)-lysidine synthase
MTRNRIRHEILPVLAEQVNPRIVDALARTAEIIDVENAWIDGLAAKQLTAATLNYDGASKTLSAAAFAACPLALQRRMARTAIGQIKGDTLGISHDHVDAVVALACQNNGRGCLHLPGRIQVTRQYDQLTLRRRPSSLRTRPPAAGLKAPYRFEVHAPAPGECRTVQFDAGIPGAAVTLREAGPEALDHGYSAGHHVAFFDMEKLQFPLILRSVRQGDRFQPLGMAGSQKVYKLLKDRKIVHERRSLTPVLVSGGNIIWVPGVKMAQPAAVTAETRRVIRADFILPLPE